MAETATEARVAERDGSYPRPQLVRDSWASLDGSWDFAYDDERVGRGEGWYRAEQADRFDRTITVPFPPESPASGISDTGFHPVVWYRRVVDAEDLAAPETPDARTLIHFGAVDHEAQVWFDEMLVGEHVGGQTPFTVDVTDLVADGRDDHLLVVRAEDDPLDVALPRGKQDWQATPHGIWYHRTTGIWQSVWTETAAPVRLVDVAWTPDLSGACVHCEVTLSQRPIEPMEVEVRLELGGDELARQSVRVQGPRALLTLAIPALANGQDRERLVWSPEQPTLVDAQLTLRPAGRSKKFSDRVSSYLGLRSVGVGRGHFLLNGMPYYVRSVLDQGYREQTHLANAGTGPLRAEVEMIKELGFNAVRVHQKAEDPRFLYWADRLGLLVWGETANAYEFSTRAVELLTREWLELVRRDVSHPSIVTWVPINESWGVQDIAVSPAQQSYSVALAQLTRALDPTRPVVSNEGWEHLDSDILGVHDYSSDVETLLSRYGDDERIAATLSSPGPAGRAPIMSQAQQERFELGDAPLMITEFGGVSYAGAGDTWGYSTVTTDEAYAELLGDIFDALRACPGVHGFCYTQLVDTLQETNGLLTADGRPKLPISTLRAIVTGKQQFHDP